VWRDEKTVNVITTACFNKVTKIMVTAIKFFLGNDNDEVRISKAMPSHTEALNLVIDTSFGTGAGTLLLKILC
jgi:hypothetical protein